MIRSSVLFGHYECLIDRESAYEILKAKTGAVQAQEDERHGPKRQAPSALGQAGEILGDMAKSAARSIGSQIGRQIMRGILGSLFAIGNPCRKKFSPFKDFG